MNGTPEKNVVGLCVKEDMKSFSPSNKDAQNNDVWRMRIKRQLANVGLPEQMFRYSCVCVSGNKTRRQIRALHQAGNVCQSTRWENEEHGNYSVVYRMHSLL